MIVPIASLVVAVFAATAAAISARTASLARDDLVKADRERRLREVSLLANKIDTTVADVYELYQELKTTGDGMFNRFGSLHSGERERFQSRIKEKRDTVESIQQATRCLLKNNLTTLNDEQVTKHLLTLDGHLVHVERVQRALDADLASVKAEISSDLLRAEIKRLSM